MRVWLGLGLLLIAIHGARAHEIRPAYLQVDESAAQGYEILWKRPMIGDIAVHLVPHLSGGWLDRAPDSEQRTSAYAIARWHIAAHSLPALAGQTVSIEGLENTITDTLVVVHDGAIAWQSLLTPMRPSQVLDYQGGHPASTLPSFMTMGVEHILTGSDHLLFILALVFVLRDRWMLLKTLTAFTCAHSLTLAMATLHYLTVPVAWIEAQIALSILFLASEILRARRGGTSLTIRHPWCVAFLFGLLHGLGFAGGLSRAGLPPEHIPAALLLFNVGVEIGQLAFVAAVLTLLHLVRRLRARTPPALQQLPVDALGAYAIGTVAAFWSVQRLALLVTGAA